jgi:IS30 family transposase
VLHFSCEQIADYIGDEPETVRREYLNHNRIYNPTAYVTSKNLEIRRIAKEKSEQNEKNDLLETIVDQYKSLAAKFDASDNEKNALKAQVAAKDVQLAALLEENGRLRQESKSFDSGGAQPP